MNKACMFCRNASDEQAFSKILRIACSSSLKKGKREHTQQKCCFTERASQRIGSGESSKHGRGATPGKHSSRMGGYFEYADMDQTALRCFVSRHPP